METVDNSKEVCLQALCASLVVTGVLFLILLPAVFKAFRLHRRPEIEVKPPTKEMLGK